MAGAGFVEAVGTVKSVICERPESQYMERSAGGGLVAARALEAGKSCREVCEGKTGSVIKFGVPLKRMMRTGYSGRMLQGLCLGMVARVEDKGELSAVAVPEWLRGMR